MNLHNSKLFLKYDGIFVLSHLIATSPEIYFQLYSYSIVYQ